MSTEPRTDKREAIMNAATLVVQTDGYNALSFRDLAAETGIKSASVHYHFPTKGDLAQALIERFRAGFLARMEPVLEKGFDEAMGTYIALFRGAFDGGHRMCMGGMMSAEFTALPVGARDGLEEFANAHRNFIVTVLLKKHPNVPIDKLNARAAAIFAALEGAQLIAKGLGGKAKVFDEIVDSYRASGLLD